MGSSERLGGTQAPLGAAPWSRVPWPERAPDRSRRIAIVLAMVPVAIVVGVGATIVPPVLVIMAVAGCTVIAAVVAKPHLAAYALIGITPLVAGIDRGRIIPVLRPAEALALLLAAGLVLRAAIMPRTWRLSRRPIPRMDRAILFLAIASSILPLAWMAARRVEITQDDVLYALMLWKYYGIYLTIRVAVRTERQIQTCLWIAMGTASIVAVVAVLQSLQLFGVTRLLAGYFTPYGDISALEQNRGGATLSLPIAVADLMTMNLAIAVTLFVRSRSHRGVLAALGCTFALGVVASGQFSGMIAMLIGLVTVAIVLRRGKALLALAPVLILAPVVMRPVIERRLSGFGSASGLPESWEGRLYNLTNYFWPELFSDGSFLLGVRVAARVPAASIATGYVWIESGYTWLLWSGGIPLLVAFGYFCWVAARASLEVARRAAPVPAAAATAAFAMLVVIAVLMVIDPHLTYRGSADLLFALLALVMVGSTVADEPDGTPAGVSS